VIEDAIRAKLAAFAGLSALVGTRIAQGGRVPGSDWPAVAFSLIADEGLDLVGSVRSAVARITAHGRTPLEAGEVAEQVALSLATFTGSAGGVTLGGAWLASMMIEDADIDEADAEDPAECSVEARITYTRT
jgi:hypothetical protein